MRCPGAIVYNAHGHVQLPRNLSKLVSELSINSASYNKYVNRKCHFSSIRPCEGCAVQVLLYIVSVSKHALVQRTSRSEWKAKWSASQKIIIAMSFYLYDYHSLAVCLHNWQTTDLKLHNLHYAALNVNTEVFYCSPGLTTTLCRVPAVGRTCTTSEPSVSRFVDQFEQSLDAVRNMTMTPTHATTMTKEMEL